MTLTKEEQHRRALERRQRVVELLQEPHTITQVREVLSISYNCAKDDMEYLKHLNLLTLVSGVPKGQGNNGAKYICKQVTLRPTDVVLSDFKAANYPDFMLKMLGYTNTSPDKVGRVFENSNKPVQPQPLRHINTAWMNYQSGLELA
jgi:hypothetical protein